MKRMDAIRRRVFTEPAYQDPQVREDVIWMLGRIEQLLPRRGEMDELRALLNQLEIVQQRQRELKENKP